MHTVNKILSTLVLSTALAFAPAARAQSPADLGTMQSFIDIMQGYYRIIEATHAVADDAEKAAILQMQKIKEVYEQRGEKARAVDVYRQVLENSRNPAIRNAAYVLISETLKETGRTEEAIRYLRQAIDENIAAANEG